MLLVLPMCALQTRKVAGRSTTASHWLPRPPPCGFWVVAMPPEPCLRVNRAQLYYHLGALIVQLRVA